MTADFIFNLIEKFNAGSLAELDYRDESSRLVLRKAVSQRGIVTSEQGSGMQTLPAQCAPVSASDGTQVPSPKSQVPGSPSAPDASGAIVPIPSPMVAAFYNAPAPDAPPFVSAGSRVKAGDTLCILEAMKMMNHLEAEYDCEVVSVEAGNGDLVEYGQTLFRVKKC
ncbi:MAG: acetyl-CoA carboxylase biotin carboxyl carrier protein [Treponema sp.]|nr:acetyl-CoA carboxylase biotin carboxyl carrier protein [Treponema sp.]